MRNTILMFEAGLVGFLCLASLHIEAQGNANCEDMTVSICNKMPYSLTRFPNAMGHQTQADAEAYAESHFVPLKSLGCPPGFFQFMCLHLAPPCLVEDVPTIPCRDLCESGIEVCFSIMRDHGLETPVNLDCSLFPDADSGICFTDSQDLAEAGDIRLAGGNDTAGRVEIYHEDSSGHGEWGTICDERWGIQEAQVVCRQLGYREAISAPGNAAYGEGTGPIHFADFRCDGYELDLISCEKSSYASYCQHSQDASVLCSSVRTDPNQEFRDDLRCGSTYDRDFIAPNGEVAICNKDGPAPCCSKHNWCGDSLYHCNCKDCFDFRIPDSARTYRDDHRCGPNFPAPNGEPAKCDPFDLFPCCNTRGWCGNDYEDDCTCDGCVDYRPNDPEMEFRYDFRCGEGFVAPNGEIAKCKRDGTRPCCSADGRCCDTNYHCRCDTCIDYREIGGFTTMAMNTSEHTTLSVTSTPAEGDLRLADGPNDLMGRLEVFLAGEWGTVCAHGFTLSSGDVACKQLGFPGVTALGTSEVLVGDSVPIHMDDVTCEGDEEMLMECTWHEAHDCDHQEDVKLLCESIPSQPWGVMCT